MSILKVRKIHFEFDSVEFIWNPSNPAFSVSMNLVSFYIPAFERYLVKSMVEAEKIISDPGIREVAKQFRLQEGQHAKVHLDHVAALVKQYPGLQKLSDDMFALVDELYASKDLKFHLAFGAALEATFTPLFKMTIDYRRELFAHGDSRVASMLLWHFSEEIEHRSAAMEVYEAVYGSHWYRVSILPEVLRFHIKVVKTVQAAFREHVPNLAEECFTGNPYTTLPLRVQLATYCRLLASQLPWYDHENQPLPKWSLKWFEHYERGDDMSAFYGTSPGLIAKQGEPDGTAQ